MLLTAVVVTSAGDASTLDTFSPFINATLAGVVVVMVILRKGLVPEWVLRQAEEQIKARDAKIEALEARVTESTALMIGQVVPLLTRAVDVEAQYLEAVQGGRDERGDRSPRATRGR